MLITDNYRAQNEHLHATTAFGTTAPRFMEQIKDLVTAYRVETILDYGSGPRCHVEREFGRKMVRSYDPCVVELSAVPAPAHLLVSCDVLEHIEPDLLDNVLDNMASLTERVAFLTIAMRLAKKVLPDGRNAHLIVEGPEYWMPRLMIRWRMRQVADIGGELLCVMESK